MKKFMFLFCIGLVSSTLLFASGNPVLKATDKGNSIEVSVVSEGAINLFSHESEQLPATIPQDPLDSYTRAYTTYYISKGDGEMKEVHCSNYKKILKAEMSDKPEMAARIGKKGYKLSDILEIINAYNAD